jgi:ribonuclease HI
MKLEIFTDGGCSGNPGPAAIGVVIKNGSKTVKTLGLPIGQGTNNTAEYTALIYALQEALILKADEVSIKTDSELMCKQDRKSVV